MELCSLHIPALRKGNLVRGSPSWLLLQSEVLHINSLLLVGKFITAVPIIVSLVKIPMAFVLGVILRDSITYRGVIGFSFGMPYRNRNSTQHQCKIYLVNRVLV